MSSRPSRGAARLAAILDALPDALVLVNANGTVVNANAIALEAFEAPGTALVGRGLLDLLPEFDSRLIPGSMRRPDSTDERGRTKPKRMIARRTDGFEFPVEVTSSSLEDSRNAYDERYGHGGYGGSTSYSGDEMLMIVVRDLSGALNTEAELARSQRQTEMILRAAAEGVVGTDTDGRVVLVNPAAAQILGFRASDLGGQELHPLVLHSRADGEPFPYDESPLADTLRSGRKHRVRGQVLWAKSGEKVSVDLTTAPVRDGDQLVGAVMTFTDRRPYDALAERHETALAQHAEELREAAERRAEELAAEQERYAALAEREKDRYEAFAEQEQERYDALAARHEQLVAVLDRSLRGPLDEMRRELAALAADDAGQLWPEANQVLHHLSAGYARMTTLVDNVLGFQRLEAGDEDLARTVVPLDAVVAAGVDGAVELIGPGRAQFAVHAPPVAVQVDAHRLATALAHLIADVAGIDATGNTRAGAVVSGGPEAAAGYVDSTIVVAAAQRGEVVRIEVRGPYTGGDPVHEPVVQGIVRAHGGVLQTHEVPGTSGSAYVLEVPVGDGSGVAPGAAGTASAAGTSGTPGTSVEVSSRTAPAAAPEAPAQGGDTAGTGAVVPEQAGAPSGGGRRRARRSSVDSFLDSGVPGGAPSGVPGAAGSDDTGGAEAPGAAEAGPGGGTGRRRRRAVAHGPAEPAPLAPPAPGDTGTGTSGDTSGGTGRRRGRPSPAEGAVMTAAEHAAGSAALGQTVPPQGVPSQPVPPQGDAGPSGRRARRAGEPQALALPSGTGAAPEYGDGQGDAPDAPRPGGRRARRALAAAQERAAAEEASNSRVFALPPAAADRDADSGALVGAEQVTGQADGQASGHAAGQAAQGGARQLAGARSAGAQQDPHGAVATEAGPAQVGASVNVPAGVQAGLQGAARGGVPTQSRARGAVAQGGRPAPAPEGDPMGPDDSGQHAVAPQDPADDHTPPQPHPTQSPALPAQAQPSPALPAQAHPQAHPQAPTGRRRARQAPSAADPAGGTTPPRAVPVAGTPAGGVPTDGTPADGTPAGGTPSAALPPERDPRARAAQPLPAEAAPVDPNSTQGRAISVRTLGQGVPFGRQPQPPVQQPQAKPPQAPAQPAQGGSGRRRKLGTPPEPGADERPESAARPHPQAPQAKPQPRLSPGTEGTGRSYAIGAPDENAAEGPEPLDGPGGAVEVTNRPQPQPMDDELPPEPLDNPRRLLVWPAPDVTTQQALSDRGYRPVIVHSREEVDAQIAAFPAALFVDPLTGPITRTALQSLRQAAVAAEVPVLVTAGLGQASREAAYGADPAVLLKALAPRDSEQHPPRVLLIEEHEEIALALTATLERRGMQVARAESDADAVTLAAQTRPNLVVMDLHQVRRRRAGIIDWLRANGQLNRTPLVVYTAAVDETDLPKLAAGETVLFLAERSTSGEVQTRIVDLLAKIGTN